MLGIIEKLSDLVERYSDIVVAIGDPNVRCSILEKIEQYQYTIATLISPKAYTSPTAQIMEGCIVEHRAVVQSNCKIAKGYIISVGTVVNHGATRLDVTTLIATPLSQEELLCHLKPKLRPRRFITANSVCNYLTCYIHSN